MIRSWSEDVHIDLCPKLVSAQCERIDGLGSYFAYILLLTIPSLGLSHDIFRQFSAELLALINGQK